MTAQDWIKHLDLLSHPEGGYYKETYRSDGELEAPGFVGPRHYSTAIYFLIEKNNFSALHRIKSDEIWHFYAGDPLEVIEIDEAGNLIQTVVGTDVKNNQVPQYVVKAGRWFGSRVLHGGMYSLVGCTVAPGFDFKDFEMAKRGELVSEFPEHADLIRTLTR